MARSGILSTDSQANCGWGRVNNNSLVVGDKTRKTCSPRDKWSEEGKPSTACLVSIIYPLELLIWMIEPCRQLHFTCLALLTGCFQSPAQSGCRYNVRYTLPAGPLGLRWPGPTGCPSRPRLKTKGDRASEVVAPTPWCHNALPLDLRSA